MQKITVIGAGNGGVTAAYHFSKLGHEVCLYDHPSFTTQIDAINQNGGITAVDNIHDTDMILHGFEKIKRATTSIEDAIAFSHLLIMIVPSFAQETLFKLMLPFLTDEHILVSMPGNYASLVLENVKRNLGFTTLDLTFVDAMTIPWACRVFEPGIIGIMGIKQFIYAGVFPKSKTKATLDRLNSFFPIPVKPLTNVIEAGLENINFGGHPLITTINIGLLENYNGEFNYYVDCVSPSTDKASAIMEKERICVGKSMGIDLKSELDMMNELYNTHAESVYAFNKNSVAHAKIHSAPNSAKNRYISEDVPNILVPCYEFSKLFSIEVPIIESCIRIASAYNDVDYFKEGRTLEKMGLVNMDKRSILEYVNN